MPTTLFYISQLNCSTEEKLILEQLESLPGIKQLEFNLIQQKLTVTHQLTDIAFLQKTLASLGMIAHLKDQANAA